MHKIACTPGMTRRPLLASFGLGAPSKVFQRLSDFPKEVPFKKWPCPQKDEIHTKMKFQACEWEVSYMTILILCKLYVHLNCQS